VKYNPITDFDIDKEKVRYIGCDLQRPECILAERDGTLWSADARGGVVRLSADGRQEIVTQKRSDHFQSAGSEASRYLQGTLPNGLAFARNGDFLISNFGTDCLELMSRDGDSRVLADTIDVGGKVLWLQQGLWHEQVARDGEAAGLQVVMDRCLKVDHARLLG